MSILQDEEIVNTVVEQKNKGIYKLPTLLTDVQRELQEVLIELFRQDLLEVYRKKHLSTKKKTSINSLLEDNLFEIPTNDVTVSTTSAVIGGGSGSRFGFTSTDRINLLFEQLRLIDRHPTLLVDHFMPRKLLLLDINERMLNILGKFQLFNKVVDSFIDQYPSNERINRKDPVQVLVVAPTVKELELIEGLIIGKKLYYKNLSSGKLYEDNRELPQWTGKSRLHTALNAANGNGGDMKGGRRKRRKFQEKSVEIPTVNSNLCLHLITTQQLYNHAFDIKFNLIFSFDVSIDVDSPSIELIRNSFSGSLSGPVIKTPILMPIPGLSIEHCILRHPYNPDTSGGDNGFFDWKLKCIATLITNRFQLRSTPSDSSKFYIQSYGRNMSKLQDWFLHWDTENFPLLEFDEILRKSPIHALLSTFYSESELETELTKNYLKITPQLAISGAPRDEVTDYKTFKKVFAKIVIDRVELIDKSIEKVVKPSLEQFRKKETEIQLEIDEDNIKIGENYRALQKVNENVAISERKVVRIEGDLTKYTTKEANLQLRINTLKETIGNEGTLNPAREKEIDSVINSQFSTIDELRSKLQSVKSELSKLNNENERVRGCINQVPVKRFKFLVD